LAANLNFGASKFSGLQAYEAGVVKEGVGVGGTSIAAIAKTQGALTKETLLQEIERNYVKLVNSK
jgi:NaMN:DMB phosphoribosyltransferase